MPNRQAIVVVLLVVGIFAGVFVRCAFPGADPPLHRQTGAVWWDEVWGFSARNGYLFGSWEQDEWRPWVACPVHTLLLQGSFIAFGYNVIGRRLPAMAGGILLIALSYLCTRLGGFSRRAGLVAAFILATSWAMTGFSKSMTCEPSVFSFYFIGVTFLLIGERASRYRLWAYAAAGVFVGLSALSKTSGLVMGLPLGLYLMFGPVMQDRPRPWSWRVQRAACFGFCVAAVYGAGFFIWMLPNWGAFDALVLRVSALDRADVSWWMRIYKAGTWLDSQAFLTMPAMIPAILLLLPGILPGGLKTEPWANPARRFATGLCLASLGVGIAILINFDVPARRLVYLNMFVAVLGGCVWDAVRPPRGKAAVNPDEGGVEDAPSGGWVWRICLLGACLISGLVISGWLVSPHGGILAFVAPSLAAYLLFTMSTKIVCKLSWLLLGFIFGAAIYRFWPRIWTNRRRVLAGAIVFQFVFYLFATGLWLGRLSYTVRDASRDFGDAVPEHAYVLGSDAAALGYYNSVRAIFYSAKVYLFGNYDEERIEADYNPDYMLVNEFDLAKMRNGGYTCGPYVQSFLENEVDRFTVFEMNESTRLAGDMVLLKRGEPRPPEDTASGDSPATSQ